MHIKNAVVFTTTTPGLLHNLLYFHYMNGAIHVWERFCWITYRLSRSRLGRIGVIILFGNSTKKGTIVYFFHIASANCDAGRNGAGL